VRRLIINADDFGLTLGVNCAVTEAQAKGIVTSATLMAGGEAFSNAVELAATLPNLSVGCHVVLVDGSPVSDPAQVSTLLRGGKFLPTIGSFALRAFANCFDPVELERETTAQVRKLQAAGIRVTHLDTHKHAHMFPQVLQPLLRAAQACGVRAVRNPFESRHWAQLKTNPGILKRAGQSSVLRLLAGRFRRMVYASGLRSPDGAIGVAATGILDLDLFRSVVTNLPEGTWELVCHPGYNDADLARVRTRLRDSRATELQLLTSAAARRILEENEIQLISYVDLVR